MCETKAKKMKDMQSYLITRSLMHSLAQLFNRSFAPLLTQTHSFIPSPTLIRLRSLTLAFRPADGTLCPVYLMAGSNLNVRHSSYTPTGRPAGWSLRLGWPHNVCTFCYVRLYLFSTMQLKNIPR